MILSTILALLELVSTWKYPICKRADTVKIVSMGQLFRTCQTFKWSWLFWNCEEWEGNEAHQTTNTSTMISAKMDLYIYIDIDIDMYVYIYTYISLLSSSSYFHINIFVIPVSLSSRCTFILYGSRSPWPPPWLQIATPPALSRPGGCAGIGFSMSAVRLQPVLLRRARMTWKNPGEVLGFYGDMTIQWD